MIASSLSPHRPPQPARRNIRYRDIRPDDWHRLQRFHARLSSSTINLRFHAAKRELSEPLAHRFTGVNGTDDVALVATTGTRGRIVAVARYNRLDEHTAEVAFVVEDSYQGQGIGRSLMQRLRARALAQGINRFVADVLPGNIAMLHVLGEAGRTQVHMSWSICEVHVDLTAPPEH